MPKSALKVVLAGCGGMANGWVDMTLKTPALQLVGLMDIRKQQAEAMAAKHNLPATIAFDSLKEAIKATQPDIVFDVTVPAAHDQVVTEALKAGCHVMGEKPMSDSMAKAKKMVAMATKAGRVYAVTQNYRYNPQIKALQQFVHSGKMGEVEEVHADFYIGAHFGGFRDEMDWVLLLDMAIHTFDASRFISGADPVAVYCHSWNPTHSWYKGAASAVAIFEMTKGIVFSYRGSWCAEGLQTSWNSRWRIIGAKGTATWDGGEDLKTAILKKNGKKGFTSEMVEAPLTTSPMEHTGHRGLLQDFLTAIRTGKKPPTVCDDNIKSLAMVHAAVESARSGKRVKVAW